MTPKKFIVRLLLVVLLVPLGYSSLCAQARIVFFMGERDYHQDGSLYTAQLWVYVAPGYVWKVGSSLINIDYNRSAMSAVVSDTVWDVHPEFRQKGYTVRQSDYGTSTALSLTTFGTQWVEIEGAVKLGVIRWNVIDGSQADDLRILWQGGLQSVIYDSTEAVPAGWGSYEYWTPFRPTARIIDPATASCTSQYYRDSNCITAYDPSPTTLTPVQDSCMYWHRRTTPTGVGPHIVYYQYDMSRAPIGTTRVLHFLTQSLDSLLEIARCRWTRQLIGGELEWSELANPNEGGIFRWSQVEQDFELIPGMFIALTRHALHANDLTKIVAASPCGSTGRQNAQSEILFNDTQEFYVFNPHYRWTTDYHTCGYSPRCLDFESIALHELGHYLGAGHQENPTSVIWGGYDGRNVHVHQCDANAVRRLYSPQLLAQTPVPLPDNSVCSAPTGVEEQPVTSVIVGPDVQVYPMPITDGRFSIRVQLEIPTRVAFSILDVTGRTVQTLSDTYQLPGEQHYSFSVDLRAGTYFLKVETGAGSSMEKIVVVR